VVDLSTEVDHKDDSDDPEERAGASSDSELERQHDPDPGEPSERADE